jgi:hypothetical protein
MRAVDIFEKIVRERIGSPSVYNLYLQKLESFDDENPEYRYRAIDEEWQNFREGFIQYQNQFFIWRYEISKKDGTPLLLVLTEEEAAKYNSREDLVVTPVYKR